MDESARHQTMNLFRLTDQTLKRAIGRKGADTGGFRSQHRLLMFLGKHPDCSQSVIAEKLEISPAAVAVSLKKLEKAGYISRQSNVEDNRINHIVVTDKGKAAISQSIIYFQEIEEAMFEGFTMEELELLESFFRRIIENGDNYYRNLQAQGKPGREAAPESQQHL